MADRTIAQAVTVDAGHRAQQAVGQFNSRHFQADEQHRSPTEQRYIFGNIQSKGGLSHTGTGGQDEQFAVVHATTHGVVVGKVGVDATVGVRALHARIDSLHGAVDQVADIVGRLATAIILDLKYALLGLAEQFAGFEGFVVGVFEDRRAGFDQLAKRGFAAHDLSVVDRVGRIGDAIGQFGQVGATHRPLRNRWPL